jgi:hypothetical protein
MPWRRDIKRAAPDAETGEVSSDDHGDAMTGSTTTRLRVGLIAQALVTGGLTVGPLDPGRWLPFVVGVAAGAVLLAWFIGTGTSSAWTMTLGFELLALVVGGTGAASGHYVPGTVVGLAVVIQLVLPSGRRAVRPTKVALPAPTRLTPPPVITARPEPSRPPAFPPPGVLVSPSTAPPTLPPPPRSMPPADILPRH